MAPGPPGCDSGTVPNQRSSPATGWLAAIVESSGDAIIGKTLDGRITSWNRAAERMYGYSAPEAVGADVSLIVPPERIDELRSILERVGRGERVEHAETQRVCKDGTTVDVSVAVSPVRDPSGVIVGASAVARDITESKRAVEALQASEARKAAILGSALDAIITMDHLGRVVEFNPAAERTFGYAAADSIGKDLAELIIPDVLRTRHREGLAAFLRGGEGRLLGRRTEVTAIRADGSELPVELSVTRVDMPGDPLFTGYLRDLTETSEMRDALVESERRLQDLIDNSPSIIYIQSEDGHYLFVNHQFEDAFGFERGTVKGRSVHDLWPEKVADAFRASDLSVLQSGQPEQAEEIVPHPDGDHTYFTVKFPLFDAAGRAYATARIATDITDKQRLERQLNQSQRLESLGQLAGGVAHDFNNLLAAIINYAAFVKEEVIAAAGADPGRWQPVRRDVEQIERAAGRAAGLTHQLLAFARQEVTQPETLNLNDVIVETEEMLRTTIGEHIDLVTAPATDLWPVMADAGRLEQVLVNLAVNARDAMPDGGTLTIEAHNADVDADYASIRPGLAPGRYVRLRVSDTGTGMDRTVLQRAFEPFFTTKPKGQGTGLGLATIYGIVTQAGGQAQIYSEPGHGTTFTALLPAANSHDSRPPPTEPVEAASGARGQTILVVEDDDDMRAVAERILARSGYAVLTAQDGPAAIEMVRTHSGDIDLLLTDVVMPNMLGREVAHRVQTMRPSIRVLYMSGYAQPSLGSTGSLEPGVILLEKPFSQADLLAKVHQTLHTTGQPEI
jgi:PAS domain S-box-containing protein